MNAVRLLAALRWSFCAFIVWASAETFLAIWHGPGEAHAGHLGAHGQLILSVIELGGALALLAPPLGKAAAMTLCVVFAIAGVVTLAGGEAPLRFVYYAATAAFLGFPGRKAAPLAP